MEDVLLIAAVVCVLSILGSKISEKMGISGLLVFLFLGMFFGIEGPFQISFNNYHVTEKISTVALIFIMFYGGFGTNYKVAKPVIAPSIILSTAGVFFTAVITGIFAHWILKCSLLEGILLGAVVASTDAASVFAILRLKNLNLTGGLASVLEIESGSNDPFAYLMTTILLGIMASTQNGSIAVSVLLQILFGVLGGVLVGKFSSIFLKKMNLEETGMHYVFMIASAMSAYAIPTCLGGNGFLSVYIAGILIGNQKIPQKVQLVHFFDGITGIMQIILFFLLGLLAAPFHFREIIIPAILIAVVLTVIARPIVVFGLLTPFRFTRKQKLFLSFAGLRGAASIVFAIYTVISSATMKNDIFHIVVCIAILSVGIQGTLLPWMAEKLELIDKNSDVHKTFNDYQQDTDMNLIGIRLKADHPWIGKMLKDISMPVGMLAVMIKRGGETLIPHGDTKIQADDRIVLSCLNYVDNSEVKLHEVDITKKHKWQGKTVNRLDLPRNRLIVMMKRGEDYLIPDGKTKIERGDTIVICEDINA